MVMCHDRVPWSCARWFISLLAMTGSGAFMRLLVSLSIRGWEEGFNAIRSARAYVWSLVQGRDMTQAVQAQTFDRLTETMREGRKTRKLSPKYQARGRNPLASPLASLLQNASKSTSRLLTRKKSEVAPGRGAAPRRLLWSHDHVSDYKSTPVTQRAASSSARNVDAHKMEMSNCPCEWPEAPWSISRARRTPSHRALMLMTFDLVDDCLDVDDSRALMLMTLDLALSPAQEEEQEQEWLDSIQHACGPASDDLWPCFDLMREGNLGTVEQNLMCNSPGPASAPSTEESCRETEYSKEDWECEDVSRQQKELETQIDSFSCSPVLLASPEMHAEGIGLLA